MGPFLERLHHGEILISDGALGTMLMREGLQPGQCPDVLVVEQPDLLASIAGQYLEAGADIIHTNTFGASPMRLSDYGLEEKTEEINKQAANLVEQVVDDRAYVSGSSGPSGKILQPYGDAEEEILYGGYERQMKALTNAGVDIICIETMIDLREAVLAVKATKAVSPQTPIMATMTFDKTPKGYFTVWGNSIEEAAVGLQEAGADLVGSNCGHGIETMVEIARRFREATSLPLLIQSNAGPPETIDGEIVYAESPELFAEKTHELIDIGVAVIGGCCGTTPDHIRAIRGVVDSR